jgi:hypothetical protein
VVLRVKSTLQAIRIDLQIKCNLASATARFLSKLRVGECPLGFGLTHCCLIQAVADPRSDGRGDQAKERDHDQEFQQGQSAP